ncbi:hypothetical protein B0H15DRAFT_806198 [Mycena belliarum]|uniref:Uncharacterized protein n=1 Tax=Mycena belliarum TaxID=1033014 RepID=A0AAD6TRB2_9AGAR|nr:hypothetical protein B0H15DRAFT_806198 [Mycena belliae]
MSSASRKRKAPSEVSLMDEDLWQHFRHCPDIQRIISYFHDPTVKKANLGVAEQAYTHFLEAVRAYRAWAPKSRFPAIESFIYTAAMSLFAFFTRVQSSETRKHYEFRAMYTDLAKLAPKHHPANIDPPTADFVFPELDTVETLPSLPPLDTAPHSSPPLVPQLKRPKLETGAQSSPAASASRQPAPKPVRRPVPVKAAPRISLSPRSLPSLPRIARPVPSTSKAVKAPARPSLPTLPVEPDPDSEDDKSQDQEPDADADAEAEVDDDEEEEAQFTPEEDPEEEPAPPAPKRTEKSKGKGKVVPPAESKAVGPSSRPGPVLPIQRPPLHELDDIPLVVGAQAVGTALGPEDNFSPAMFPCTQCHGTATRRVSTASSRHPEALPVAKAIDGSAGAGHIRGLCWNWGGVRSLGVLGRLGRSYFRVLLSSRPKYKTHKTFDLKLEGETAYATRQAALQCSLRDRFLLLWKDLPELISDGQAAVIATREAAAAKGREASGVTGEGEVHRGRNDVGGGTGAGEGDEEEEMEEEENEEVDEGASAVPTAALNQIDPLYLNA